MTALKMQQDFWGNLEQTISKGIRFIETKNYKGLGIDFGCIEYDNETLTTWYGQNRTAKPRLMMLLKGLELEVHVLIEFTDEECAIILTDYQEQGISVEILNVHGNSCINSKDNPVFVRSCEVYRESFNQTNQLIAILDKELHLRYANRTLLKYLNMTMNDILGIPYWDLPVWSHSAELQNKIVFSIEQMHLGNDVRFETTHLGLDGQLRDIDFIIKPIFDQNNDVDLLIAMGYDVTESKLAESALKRTEKELKMFFDYSVNGYFINRLSESVYLDPETLDQVFGYVQRHEKIITYNNAILQQIDIPATIFENTKIFDLLHISHEESIKMWREMVEEGYIRYEADIEVAGVRKILDCTFVPILEHGNRYSGSFGIIKDQTEEVLRERKMVYLATKDSLTSTNNRRHFLESAWNALHELEDTTISPSVIMLDIDDFKNVNDTYGHDIGDKVLVEMTERCEYILDGKGIYGRMGGEEFAAYLFNEDGQGALLAEELRAAIEALVVKTELGPLQFTVSIGYTEIQKGHTMEDALKRADKALYKAKRSGKNKVETILF